MFEDVRKFEEPDWWTEEDDDFPELEEEEIFEEEALQYEIVRFCK